MDRGQQILTEGHAWTYEGRNPVAALHRARRDRIVRTVRGLDLPAQGTVADFGCSDGGILALLRDEALGPEWDLAGFDRFGEEPFLRRLPTSRFETFDLNTPDARFEGTFDLVCCFETLEHVGDWRNAVDNVVRSAKPDGRVVLSMPVETGVAGFVKYAGRRVVRRNAYGDFFPSHRDELRYIGALVTGGDITRFRNASRRSWGPHLGFDWKRVREHLRSTYGDRWTIDETRFGVGVILTMRPRG